MKKQLKTKLAISNGLKLSFADELILIIRIWGKETNKTCKAFINFIDTNGFSALSEYFVIKLLLMPIGYNNSLEIIYKKKFFILIKGVIIFSWWNKQ